MNVINNLAKWGNGQGVRIPKAICEQIGASVGDIVNIWVGPDNTLVLSFLKAKYQRRRIATMDDLLRNRKGSIPSVDLWGEDIGAEVVE
ncbi:MAG: AbrB/MazE/SpoVT family DNA-binding domain-containing protein [Coriobacteriia bacterium]|nr:AbrB/MazE/SpoVT family DNA-binding domain-containing protein [Coriobacteriia bacterium]